MFDDIGSAEGIERGFNEYIRTAGETTGGWRPKRAGSCAGQAARRGLECQALQRQRLRGV